MAGLTDFNVHVFKEDDGYMATSPEWLRLPAFGHTQQKALDEMQGVLEMASDIGLEWPATKY